MSLTKYVIDHTDRNACRCGQCIDSGADKPLTGHTADLFFFDVSLKGEASADEFRRLIREHRGEFGECDPLDGKEHGYMELGGWLGDQQVALRFIGLGALLNLWTVAQLATMLGLPKDDPMAKMMAGQGYVSLMPVRSEAKASA